MRHHRSADHGPHPVLRRPRRSRPGRLLWRTLLTGGTLAALLVGGKAADWQWPARPAEEPVVFLEEGTVTLTLLADGVVVRPEAVVTAPAAGGVERLVAEGERVRVGTPVVRLTPGDAKLAAPLSGVVTYQTDGLEEVLRPDAAAGWSPSWIDGLSVRGAVAAPEGQAAEGEPLFKVVDNLAVGLVVVAPAGKVAPLAQQARAAFQLSGRETVITARVSRWAQEGERALLYLTEPDRLEELAERRRVRLSLVLGRFTGKVAPRTAIDIRHGVQGVWVRQGPEPVFHPVRVIGGNAAEVALETDLVRGTPILQSAPRDM